jgi:hypothetical protein
MQNHSGAAACRYPKNSLRLIWRVAKNSNPSGISFFCNSVAVPLFIRLVNFFRYYCQTASAIVYGGQAAILVSETQVVLFYSGKQNNNIQASEKPS